VIEQAGEPDAGRAPGGSAAVMSSEHAQVNMPGADSPTWTRLEGQIQWYDRNAASNQRWFKLIKVAQIVLGALVPVAAATDADRWVLGSFGAAIVVLEGIQQLFQFHRNWIKYRATCEALRREQHLYLACAGDYAASRNPFVLLAERLEAIVGQETTEWAATAAGPNANAAPESNG
jgi:hypothetical protein